ncbi:TIGR03089 family protein [Nocardioides sp. ChNu-153]|uniref:TIGR03089 family protein n=1 Tax=Nocardioides sp. ChNu-153 TaxID=2779364 RepID=UPI00265A8B3E|nr:TIGR03089 family protein [Nocardioides sp. ChNu-153]
MSGIVEKAGRMADVTHAAAPARHRPATFATLLADLLRAEPGRPLLTWYAHDADGQVVDRTELSVTTYANWVAKTAGLLTDALDLERGDRLLVDLPTHWLGPVVAGAAWTAGLVVLLPDHPGADEADAVVVGPDRLERWAPEAGRRVVVAAALTPLARPFATGVPAGVHDLGVEVWGQPDAYVALDPPTPQDAALGARTHAELFAATGSEPARVLAHALTDEGAVATAWSVLAAGGSLVLTDDDAPLAPWWRERRVVLERDERISPAG